MQTETIGFRDYLVLVTLECQYQLERWYYKWCSRNQVYIKWLYMQHGYEKTIEWDEKAEPASTTNTNL